MRILSIRQEIRVAVVALVALGGMAAGCSNGAVTIQGRPGQPLMSYNSKSHTVDLQLLAGTTYSGMDFDGASAGAMTVTIPQGWTVDATCINYSTTLDHSCAIVQSNTGQLAFPGSAIPNATSGLRPAGAANFSFVASTSGNYQIVCLAPGHRDAGMWDHFDVTTSGLPSLKGGIEPSAG